MRKFEYQDGKWVEVDNGILSPLLGTITNPFTGTPSTAPQQWIQIGLSMLGGIAVGAMIWKKKGTKQVLALKKDAENTKWLTSMPADQQFKVKEAVLAHQQGAKSLYV